MPQDAWLLISAAFVTACAGTPAETYEAQLADIAADVAMEVSALAPRDDPSSIRRVVVRLERWSGRAGTGYEHCPRLSDLEGTLDGVLMEVDPGGAWSDEWGCSLPVLSIDLDGVPGVDQDSEVRIDIGDGSARMRLVAYHLFEAPSVSWLIPEDGELRPGERASLAVVPSAEALLYPQLMFSTEAGPLYIDDDSIEIEPAALSFLVPPAPAGTRGSLRLHPSSTSPLFGAKVTECSGVGACSVMRCACIEESCTFTQFPPASLDEEVFLPARFTD